MKTGDKIKITQIKGDKEKWKFKGVNINNIYEVVASYDEDFYFESDCGMEILCHEKGDYNFNWVVLNKIPTDTAIKQFLLGHKIQSDLTKRTYQRIGCNQVKIIQEYEEIIVNNTTQLFTTEELMANWFIL